MSATGRNQPCPCRSGLRFKHCCGGGTGIATVSPPLPAVPSAPFGAQTAAMNAAMAHQRAGRLAAAALAYEEVLARDPRLGDASHMLGVVCMGLGRLDDAARHIRVAGVGSRWQLPGAHHNYGIALGRLIASRGPPLDAAMRARYAAAQASAPSSKPVANPLVSIVVPSYNHARYLPVTLESVFAQTYRNIELIVIDDGSSDGSAAVIEQLLARCPFPCTGLYRENRGAHATLNEAVRRARGTFVNPLNSDDAFEPERIAAMVEGIAAEGREWGFAGVTHVGEDGRAAAEAVAGGERRALAEALAQTTLGGALVEYNHAISTGNLFFSRDLFDRLGGFADYRYNHDWDFELRALWLSEPRWIDRPLYRYRRHGANTISESGIATRREADVVLGRFHRRAFSESAPNPFAPCRAHFGLAYLGRILCSGQGDALAPDELIAIHDALLAEGVQRSAPAFAVEQTAST
jgi:glycosyltransferase involved in cell wall biosynthesis